MQPYLSRISTPYPLSILARYSSRSLFLCNHVRLQTQIQLRRNHNLGKSLRDPQSHPGLSGSAKLFADAEREERDESQSKDEKSPRLTQLEQQHENWMGDESVKDAVLRMLMDKYKPMRMGTIQTAEEKLKRAPPKISTGPSHEFLDTSIPTPAPTVTLAPKTGSWATEPLLPSKDGHEPWHTVFKAPSHDTSSIKLAQISSPIVSSKPSSRSQPTLPQDDRARRLEREQRKRTKTTNKLTQAKEATFDYRLGLYRSGIGSGTGRPIMPTTMKGWTSMVEDKIERARKAGVFNNVKGRGKPLVRTTEEYNPFIAREEFLMNRIVQRNGAAPPWVEIQVELETAANQFREILREAWTRRVVRTLAMEHPPAILHELTLLDIKKHRDPAWFAKEQSYHETAVAQLNALVRKYNGLAPHAVRRAYYNRDAEIERLYEEDVAHEILRIIAQRDYSEGNIAEGGGRGGTNVKGNEFLSGTKTVEFGGSFLQWLRKLFRRWFGVRSA